MKAEPSRLIPRKPAENLELSIVEKYYNEIRMFTILTSCDCSWIANVMP